MSVNWADFKPIADANAPATSEGPSGVDWGNFKPISDASPTLADYAKGAASGVNQLVSGVGYLAERSGATNVGKYIRDIGDTGQRYWSDSMTPAGRRAAESQVFEDDPNSVIPSLGERPLQALAMGTAQSAPSMFAAAVPGGIAAAGLRGVAGMAASRGIGGAIAPIAAGAAAPIGGWGANFAGNLAARVPSALGFGAAEGAIAGASNAAQWKSDIEQMPLDELRNMQGFAEIEGQIGEQAARQQIAEQGASDILRNTTISTGGIGALTGGGALGSAFQRVTTGAKGGLFGAVGRDAAKEAGQELLQSGGERAVQNVATRDYLDPNQSVIQGVVSDALSGAAIGGVLGGVAGGGSHLVKGPLQKAAEASSATVPTDAATIPPGGQTSATVPPGAAQPAGIPAGTSPADPETQPPAAGVASADQNTPAAPGISPVPVSTAELPLPSNQAESAGVPVVDQQAPLSGEYLPASDGRAPFVSAGEIETGAIPGQFSRVDPDTGQRRISQARSITDQSQEGAAKSGNETEITQPAEPGQQAKPASVSDSARLDREKDAEALATKAARLREMAARAVGQNRIRLTDLAGRMEAAREAIVGQAGATNKDSLTVEGKAPAVTSQSPPGKFDDAIDAVVKARAKLTPIRDSAESDSDAERTNALINDVGKASLGDLQAMIRIELASKKKQNAGVKVELENVLRAGSSRLRQRAIDAVKSVRSPDSTGDPWLTVSPVVKRIVDKWGQAHSAAAMSAGNVGDTLQTSGSEKPKSDSVDANPTPAQPPIMRRDDLVGAIMRVTGGDGIHSSMAPDTVGDNANRATKLRGLFTNRGTTDLGDVATLLREDENFDVRDGEHLAELIRQASFGDVPTSMSRQERDAESAKEKQHRDRIRAMARKYGVRSVGVKFSELESRVFAMMDARHRKAVAALDERAQRRFEAAMSESQKTLSDDELDAVISDLYRQGMSPRDFWNKATAAVLKMAAEARQERALDEEPTTEEPSWFADIPEEPGDQPAGGGSESQPVDQASSRPGIELAGQTPAELAKQEADRVAAEKAKKAASDKAAADEKAANDRAEVKRRSEAAASTFELGGDAMANLTGQQSIFDAPAPSPEKQQAAKDLNDALSDLADIFGKKFRANMMPEQEQKLFPVMVRVFDAAFRLGYHSFKDAARFVLQTIREKIGAEVADAVTIDHLQGAYIAMSGGKELATAKRDVVSVESKTELEQGNVPDERSGTDLERDSENAATENGVGKKGVRDGSGRDGGAGGPGVPGAETTGSAGSGFGIPGPEALADRAASDNEVYVGSPGVSPGASGDSVSQRGGDLRLDGPPIEPDAAKGIGAAATGRPDLARKIALQASAPTDPGASIADALPMLSAGQQEDVAKAERRFAVPDGYGMLFTNGTGTGKTFSGLGIIKRFSNAGKNNILIVVPNDKIIEDWQKSGRMLGLDISELKNTKDAGKGIVVTTYANMGANSELVRREWDLVVHDEAHHLMENSEARSTNALRTLRAITLHPDGANDRHAALYADEIMELSNLRTRLKGNIELGRSLFISVAEKERIAAENARLSESLALAEKRNRETQKIVREDVESRQGAVRPRALFLSFTPFAYEPSIDWANGYLFDYNEGRPSDKTESRGYNQGSNSDQFFMQHFGYRMRTGKLTQPDAKVDRGLMQRQFNAFLKKKGSLSGRVLDVEADYDRRFLLVESAIGQRIDEALEWFEDQGKKTNDKDRKAALRDVRKVIADKFDYQSRRYLLEAIKAQEVIPHIREHMAMGRKVVVFHDYNQGGGFNPFDMNERKMGAEFSESGDTDLINSVIREFKTEFKDLIGSDLFKASSPIANFQKQFPGVLLVNGMVPAKTRRENVARFQDDASGPQLILVQSQAGKEGISLHDTTGKHQRVLFNLGQPTQPTMAMQQEGRIYRMGQVTDAIIRYLNTGTNWERWAFATTIAQRASAAENLGSGELARALKDAFISGFEESGNYRAGMEDEGKGGKARDAAANNVLSEYDRAKAFYFGTQKKDSRTKAQEGTDYYATPEPIGLKMVEFADIRAGDDVLEPSAGHGAIARWIPEHAKRTAIEPSTALRSRLAMVFDGNIIASNFEDLNVVNKFDAIVMNPPFGTGGKTAVDHLAKAATHLRDGGRIVALLPTGPEADKRLDKWLNGGEEVAVKPLATHPELGPIYKGDTISTQTETGLVVERRLSADTIVAKSPTMRAETAHLVRNIVKADPTGQRTTESGPSKDVYQIADIQLPAVTFERAGTSVRTHIVVLEKQTNKDKLNTVPQQVSRDYSGAKNISELFDRVENAFILPRENAREEESTPTTRSKSQESGQVQSDGKPATVEKMLPDGKLLTDAPSITYTTKAGKKLDGVIARTLTNAQATAIDKFTWAKDGGFFIRMKHVVRPESNNETRYNLAAGIQATTADRAVYDMAQEGKSAAEILSFIGKASRRPFNRYLANALKNLGASSTITLDSQGGWRFGNTSRAQKYAAAYNSRTDTVALFTAREAERHLLHELVHAATMKAIKAGGPAAVRMRALFKHAQKSGKVNGQYGMSNLDEFVAEAFTNPKFQEALKGVPAPAGSTLKSAWQWFVNIVSRVLGIRTSVARTALDRAMTIGAQLMRENAGIAAEETRYSLDGSQPFDGREVATTPLKPGTTTLMVDGTERPALNSNGKPIHWSEEGIRNFWRWFGDSKVVDARGRPLVVYHGSPDIRFIKEEAIFKSQKDRILLGRSEAAHWFSSDKRTAKSYADPRRAFDYQNSEEGVIESYLRIENPLVFHADGQEWKTAQKRGKTSDVIEEARASSKDGVIINNVRDDYNNSRSTRPTRTFTVFESTQIKSSTGNTGAFSPTDPDIRFSAGADWYNGPSGAPVRNAWQRAKAKAAEILSPKNLDKIIYELQDKHIDLRRLRDHIQAIGGTITDMNDAYLGEELYHKRLAHRTDEFLKTELRPLLAEMKARGVSIQDLETFLHARHAPEANAEMARRNPNQAEIDAGQKKSATLVLNLEKRLQNAKARGSATVAIEQALNDARGKLLQWNGAQAFRGTEEERRSLSGLSDADAAAIMNGLTPERRAAMDTLAARVDAINEGTLQHLQHYGLMSRESLDTWRKTYRYYVPLHRDEAHPDSANHPIGQGFSVKGDAAKRRTGSNQQVTNILGHIAMQREAALTRGEKNHVMRKLYLMARQNPLPDVWKVGEVPMIDTIDKATGFVRTVPDPLYKTRPNVIMLRIAGKDVAIVMNEHNPQALRMAQSLKNLDVDDLHYLIPVVGKMTRYFASINTQYNPIFGVINLMRDTQEAALNLSTTELAGKQKEVMTDTLSILKEVLKNKGRMPNTGAWATLFEEFNRVGGTTGYRDLFLDAESRSKSLLSELQALDRGKVSQAWNGVKEWLSDYNEAMENATRLAAYKAALDNGMSKERAASLAKNLTVNFNRKGRQTRELGALYAFFNAAVQGTTRMAQTLAGPAGRKIMAGGVLLGVMNALLGIAAMGGGDGDDDEWEKIPEFVKERSVVIPTGKDSYLAIPMPLGFQFLPNIGRLAVEMAVYKDKTDGKQMVALFQVLADAFNPMGGSSPPMQIAAPTVLDPFVALAQNKDWTGKPIYIENRSSLDPKPGLQRSKDSATPWAKGVAEAINAITGGTKYTPGGWSPTPDQIDFVIGQLTGGIGREAGKVAATATAPFTGEELPPYKIPLVGRLYGSTAGHSGQSEKFYENITKANEVENEIKGRLRDGISVAGYLADHPGATSLAARGNVAERQVSALRKARHAVTMKGGTDEASKVRVINERIANVMRNFNREADLIGKRFGQ